MQYIFYYLEYLIILFVQHNTTQHNCTMCVRTFSQQMHTVLTYVLSGEFCRELCGRSEDANGHPAVLPSQTNGAFRGTYVLYCNVLYLHSVLSVSLFFLSLYLPTILPLSVCFSFSFFLTLSLPFISCHARTHTFSPSLSLPCLFLSHSHSFW
jgi:hypothetical protein